MAKHAFWIYDAIASWADDGDEAVHAIGALFESYALPRGHYAK